MQDLLYQVKRLKEMIKEYGSAIIAFSGGVDSTFLAGVSVDVLGERALAVTASSRIYPRSEQYNALEVAKKLGIPHLIIETGELDSEIFVSNPPNRCYHCKLGLLERLLAIARERGYSCVLVGDNYDDLRDYRPGMQAALELGVKKPLLEVKLTKKDIRLLSKEMGLPTWDKPAVACLASRFPYGERITKEKLGMVDRAEEYLRSLGLSYLRVRHHGNLARIEVEPARLTDVVKYGNMISKEFKQIGYAYVTLDLDGYRTGSMNEVL